MEFQILNKDGQPITIDELDKEAATFWGVRSSVNYARPKNRRFDWVKILTESFFNLLRGEWRWCDVIEESFGYELFKEADSYDDMIRNLEANRPYIELFLYWKSKGYIPVKL